MVVKAPPYKWDALLDISITDDGKGSARDGVDSTRRSSRMSVGSGMRDVQTKGNGCKSRAVGKTFTGQ